MGYSPWVGRRVGHDLATQQQQQIVEADSLPNVVGILQSLEGLNRTKKWGKRELLLSAGLSWRNTGLLLPLD